MGLISPISCPLLVTRSVAIFIYLDPDVSRTSGSLSVAHSPQVNTHRTLTTPRQANED